MLGSVEESGGGRIWGWALKGLKGMAERIGL